MINTYNETSLHRVLKHSYAQKLGGHTEQEKDSFICDISTDDTIVEIQTSNVSSLAKKLEALLKSYSVHLVCPLAECTIIQTQKPDGTIISTRKSPKKNTVYHLFKELTGIYPLLLHPRLTIEVLMITQKEIRLKMDEPVQSANKSRHWKKDWLKIDKQLVSINGTKLFKDKKDYMETFEILITEAEASLGKKLDAFTVEEIEHSSAKKQARVMMWVYRKMKLLEEQGKDGKKRRYHLA